MLKRFAGYFKPHRKLFFLDMAAALFLAVADLVYPVVTRGMINQYIPQKNLRLLVTWGLVLLAIYVVKKGLQYFVGFYGHVMGLRMQADMRRDMFQKLQRLPFSYYDENKTGGIMSRMLNDLMSVSELAHHGPEDLLISLIQIVGSFAIMAAMSLPLTLIVFAVLPVTIGVTIYTRRKMTAAFLDSKVKVGEVNATLENSISGVRVSKAFTNDQKEMDKFRDGNQAFQQSRGQAYKVMAQFHSTMHFFIDLIGLVVLVAGGFFVVGGAINYGDFAAYLLYVNVFLGPVRRLVDFVESYQDGMTGFSRFCEVMDAQEEAETPGARDAGRLRGEIAFEGVTFRYDDDTQVLADLSLHIPQGETLALVGPSGGGKTTLCHLLPRFYERSAGRILIDGVDIRDYTLLSLRRNIGIVQQDVFLFTGTIGENIAYGRLDATHGQVEEAARLARIHDFIESLPQGYDTEIGERGVKLSGGQKQRLAIARVFLKNPPILILDEATSALDNTTELQIQQSLDALCKGRTTLVVAHRLSTIRGADEIVVLTGKGIEERGTHRDLVAAGGLYASLYQATLTQQ